MKKIQLFCAMAAMGMVFAGAGCGDDDSVGGFKAKAVSCGVLSEGELAGDMELDPDNEIGRCVNDCYSAASCDDFDYFICFIGSISPSTQACLDTCLTVSCADGVATIFWRELCDGNDNCADGSDEVGCNYFDCADGGVAREDSRCDGVDDCADSSDEDGCPRFDCVNGTQSIRAAWVCDTVDDCDDGSDEDQGCAKPNCP